MPYNAAAIEALVAIADQGTFDAAARALHVTPSAVSQRITSIAHGARSTTTPMPATPATISTTSERAYTATTRPTWLRRRPCRSTNAFCAPIATIRDRPVSRPAATSPTGPI